MFSGVKQDLLGLFIAIVTSDRCYIAAFSLAATLSLYPLNKPRQLPQTPFPLQIGELPRSLVLGRQLLQYCQFPSAKLLCSVHYLGFGIKLNQGFHFSSWYLPNFLPAVSLFHKTRIIAPYVCGS